MWSPRQRPEPGGCARGTHRNPSGLGRPCPSQKVRPALQHARPGKLGTAFRVLTTAPPPRHGAGPEQSEGTPRWKRLWGPALKGFTAIYREHPGPHEGWLIAQEAPRQTPKSWPLLDSVARTLPQEAPCPRLGKPFQAEPGRGSIGHRQAQGLAPSPPAGPSWETTG